MNQKKKCDVSDILAQRKNILKCHKRKKDGHDDEERETKERRKLEKARKRLKEWHLVWAEKKGKC